jgi:hypothetical protein
LKPHVARACARGEGRVWSVMLMPSIVPLADFRPMGEMAME